MAVSKNGKVKQDTAVLTRNIDLQVSKFHRGIQDDDPRTALQAVAALLLYLDSAHSAGVAPKVDVEQDIKEHLVSWWLEGS
jgi:hypothetical protein